MKNKKSTKKTIIITVCIWICCMLLGGVVGYFSADFEGFDLNALKGIVKNLMIYATPAISLVVAGFVIIFSSVSYNKSKSIIDKWDGEDEASIEKAEKNISITISVLTVNLPVFYVLIGIWVYATNYLLNKDLFLTLFPVIIGVYVIFLADLFFSISMQRACVQLIKKVNPEKRGEVFDLSFSKDWENSMDEAQKLMTYEAGYRAFRFANIAFIIAWIISMIFTFTGMGISAMILVSALWFAVTLAYVIFSYRIEFKNKKR